MGAGSNNLMSTQTGGVGETIQAENTTQATPEEFQANIPPAQAETPQTEAPSEVPAEQIANEEPPPAEGPLTAEEQPAIPMVPAEEQVTEEEPSAEQPITPEAPIETETDVINRLGLENIEPAFEDTQDVNSVTGPTETPDGIPVAITTPPKKEEGDEEDAIIKDEEAVTPDVPTETPDGIPIAGPAVEKKINLADINAKYKNEGIKIDDLGKVTVGVEDKKDAQGLPDGSYRLAGKSANYQKIDGKWYKDANLTGDYQPIGGENVESRAEYLESNAQATVSETQKQANEIINQRFGDLRKEVKENRVAENNFTFDDFTKGSVKSNTEQYNADGTVNFNYDPNAAKTKETFGVDTKSTEGLPDGVYRYPNSDATYQRKNGDWFIDPKGGTNFVPMTKGDVTYRKSKLNTDAILQYKPDGVYIYPGSKASYKRVNGNWLIDPTGGSNYVEMTHGDVAKRKAQLDLRAIEAIKASDYNDLGAIIKRQGVLNEGVIPGTYSLTPSIQQLTMEKKATVSQEKKASFVKAENFANTDIMSQLTVKGANGLPVQLLNGDQMTSFLEYQNKVKDIIGDGSYTVAKAAKVEQVLKDAESYFNECKQINAEIKNATSQGKSLSQVSLEKKVELADGLLTDKGDGVYWGVDGGLKDFSQKEMFDVTSGMASFILDNVDNGKMRYDAEAGQYVISPNVSGTERQYLESKLGNFVAEYTAMQGEKYAEAQDKIQEDRQKLAAEKRNVVKLESSLAQMTRDGVDEKSEEYKAIVSELEKSKSQVDEYDALIDKKTYATDAAFLTEPKKTAQQLAMSMSQDAYTIVAAIPKDITPKQQFDLIYERLLAQNDKLAKDNGLNTEGLGNANMKVKDMLDWDGFYALSKEEKQWLQNNATLNKMAPLYFNNSDMVVENGSGFWESFTNSFYSTLFPNTAKAEGYTNLSEASSTSAQKLQELGFKDEDYVTPEMAKKLEEQSKVDFWSAEKWGSMTGTTASIIVPMIATAGVPSTALRVVKGIEGLITGANVTKTAKIVSTAEKIYNSALQSTRFGRFLKPTIESAVKAEIAGNIFTTQEDELNFLSFMAGGVVSESLGAVFSKMPKDEVYKYLKGIFGNRVDTAINVIKKGGEATARGIGETGEETMQELVGIYQRTDNWGEMKAELSKQFGTFDQVQEFIVSSFIMGAGFGLAESKGAKDAYDRLPTESKEQVDAAINAIRSDLDKADDAVDEFAENKEKQQKVEQTIEENDKKDEEGVSGQVGEGQESVEGQPVAGTSEEAPSTGGVVQEEQGQAEQVAPDSEATTETPAEAPKPQKVTARSLEEAKELAKQGYVPADRSLSSKGLDNIFNTRKKLNMIKIEQTPTAETTAAETTAEAPAEPQTTTPTSSEDVSLAVNNIASAIEGGKSYGYLDSEGGVEEKSITMDDVDLESERVKRKAEKGILTSEDLMSTFFGKTAAANEVAAIVDAFNNNPSAVDEVVQRVKERISGESTTETTTAETATEPTAESTTEETKAEPIKNADGKTAEEVIQERIKTSSENGIDEEFAEKVKEDPVKAYEDEIAYWDGVASRTLNDQDAEPVKRHADALRAELDFIKESQAAESSTATEATAEPVIEGRTISQIAKDFANKIRAGKLGGGLKSSIPGFDAVWNASLEAAAKAVEAAGMSAETVQKAIAKGFEVVAKSEWFKGLNKDQQKQAQADYYEGMNNLFDEGKMTSAEKAAAKEFGQRVAEATGTAKEEKTIQMTKSEALRKQLKDKEAAGKQAGIWFKRTRKKIRDYAKEYLPKGQYTKAEIDKITSALNAKDLEAALDKIDALIAKKNEATSRRDARTAEANRQKTIKDIKNKVKSRRTTLSRVGNKWKGKITIEAQKEYAEYISNLNIDNLDSKTQEELDEINDIIDGIISEGKADFKRLKELADDAKRKRAADLIKGLAKGQGISLDSVEEVMKFFEDNRGSKVIVDGRLYDKTSFRTLVRGMSEKGKAQNKVDDVLDEITALSDARNQRAADVTAAGGNVSTDAEFKAISRKIDSKYKQLQKLQDTINGMDDVDVDVSGAVGYKQEVSQLAKSSEMVKSGKLKITIPRFFLPSINSVYNLLKKAWSGSSDVAKFIEERIAEPISRAYTDKTIELGKKRTEYYNALDKIFGKYTAAEASEIIGARGRGAKAINKLAERVKGVITTNVGKHAIITNEHVVDYYCLSQIDKGVERLKSSGVDVDRVKAIIDADPQLKAYADWLMNKYKQLGVEYEPTFALVTGMPFPANSVYYPANASDFNQNFIDEGSVMGENGSFNVENAQSNNMKQRVDYGGNLDISKGAHAKYLEYVSSMEHAKHFVPISQSINELFSTLNAPHLIQSMGIDKYNELKGHLGRILSDRPIDGIHPSWFGKALSNVRTFSVISTLGAKVNSIAKQATGFTHYFFLGIDKGLNPIKVMMGVPKNMDELLFAKEIISSEFFRERFSGQNFDVEVRRLLDEVSTSRGTKLSKSVAKLMMLSVRAGDAAAVIAGGIPYANAMYRQKMKEGMSQEEARAYAFNEFVKATNETQQTTQADYTNEMQLDPSYRMLGMYRTGQMSAAKKVFEAAETIKQARKIQQEEGVEARERIVPNKAIVQSVSNLIYFTVLSPILFNVIAGNIMGSDDEEENERMWYDLKMDTLGSILQGYGFFGYVADGMLNFLRGDDWKVNLPIMKTLVDLMETPRDMVKISQKKWETISPEERMYFLKKEGRERMKDEENYMEMMNDFNERSLFNKMNEAETNQMLKNIGAKNIADFVDNMGEFFAGNKELLDALMNYDEGYLDKAKERGKKDYIFEYFHGKPYLPEDKSSNEKQMIYAPDSEIDIFNGEDESGVKEQFEY